MKAWDLTVTLPNKAGELTKLGEELGKAGINIEGLAAFEYKGQGYVHVVVQDPKGARKVIERIGCEIEEETEVLVERVENKPGLLGECTRYVAEAGVSLTTVYLATETRIVMGATDVATLEAAWRRIAAAAR